jgi:histidinol-phosphate aminotransferase
MKTRPHLESLPPYTPIEPFEVLSQRMGCDPQDIIKLDANENPYGPSPHVRQALAEMPFPHIYPDPESRALRHALAQFTDVPENYLLAGAGADELIDLILRVLIEPRDTVLNCPPSFGMYPFDTRLNAGRLVEVPRRPDFSLDLPAIRKAVETEQPKVLFLAVPNNPDGSLPTPAEIDALLDLPTLVVLDEAYIEFSGLGRLGVDGTRLREVPRRNNLIVLRTFSKWAGLAGLRVGYGAFPEWMLPTLWKAKQPYNVSVAASVAALVSLEEAETLAVVVARLVAERQRLAALLAEIPFLHVYPSRSNFILCRIQSSWGDDATSPGLALKSYLIQRRILIRYFDSPRLRDCIRISVGKSEHTDALVKALRETVTG